MSTFSLPDFLVDVNITDSTSSFNLSYITRIIFLVLKSDLTLKDYEYIKNISSVDEIDDIGFIEADFIKNYFYKTDVKSCDILFVKDEAVIDSVLLDEEKCEINDSTFTCVVDTNINYQNLDFAFFKGVLQIGSSTVINANLEAKKTFLYFKNAPDVLSINIELTKFSSFFVNRTNFFDPVAPKQTDLETQYPVFLETEMQILTDNKMSFFSYFNGILYWINFNTSNQKDLFEYYDEQIKRAVQEACFNFLTLNPKTFYTQENLNKLTTIALRTVLQFSEPPFGFVDQNQTFVEEIDLNQIPKIDIQNEIVRINLTVSYFSSISKIKVNISKTIGF